MSKHFQGRHSFLAELVTDPDTNEKRVVVRDADGNEVKVQYGASRGNLCVTAHVAGVGCIGGWDHSGNGYRARWERMKSPPHFDFFAIVGSINAGVIKDPHKRNSR